MKKLFFLLAVIVTAIFSSCSNDDIEIQKPITFKINPETVINSYQEFSTGDLVVLPSTLKLRVRLLIYDEDGVLAASDTQKFKDYSHIMTSTLNLPEGKYTVVAMTDIVSDSNEDFAWALSGEEKLNTVKITKSEYIREQWEIMGLTTQNLYLNGNTDDVKIDVQPAGSLAIVYYKNWNYYNDVTHYALHCNRCPDHITLSNDGSVQYSIISDNYTKYRLSRVEWDSKYSGAYRYIFLFPVKGATFHFKCECTDGKTYTLGDAQVIDIENGREYYFTIDVENDEAEWLVFNSNHRMPYAPNLQAAQLKNIEANDFGFENFTTLSEQPAFEAHK